MASRASLTVVVNRNGTSITDLTPYVTFVDTIEVLTGLDFLTNVNDEIAVPGINAVSPPVTAPVHRRIQGESSGGQ